MRRTFDADAFWANRPALLREYTAAAESDDDRLALLKEAVTNALTEGERTLLVAYAEAGSQRKVAALYGFASKTAIDRRIASIRQKIADYVDNHR